MEEFKDNDERSRCLIRNDVKKNYFVDAGAGSGKTTVLVDRMVKMVEEGIDISKICAITFTKAAAGEFYERFQKELSKSDSENAKNALANIDLCFMGTIDSFCQMILAEHPLEAGIPSDAKVRSDEEMNVLYRRAYSDIQKKVLGDEALYQKCRRFKHYFWNAEEIFISGMKFLMGTKNAELQFVKPKDGTVDEIWGEEIREICAIIERLLERPEAISESTKDSSKEYALLKEKQALIIREWDENISEIATTFKNISKLRIKKEFVPRMDELGPNWGDYFQDWISYNKFAGYEGREDNDAFLTKRIQAFKTNIALDFLLDASELIADHLRKAGALTYFDFLYCLRNMLRDDSVKGGKLIRHIQNRHTYYLLDEFQDTDPLQTEVFFYLTDEHPDEPKKIWKDCTPAPGTLFVVGDPKQSIYRFKSADVTAFLNTETLFAGKGEEILTLTRNYRSTDVMCEWFNQKFSYLLPENSGDQSEFEDIPVGEKGENHSTLNGAYYFETTSGSSMKNCDCPEKVAQIIREIIDDPEQSLLVQGEKEYRRPRYSDFMVIMPIKNYMSLYLGEFLAKGIPFRVEGEVLFRDCPALVSLIHVMSGVADPYDKRARFAALNLSRLPLSEEKLEGYSRKADDMNASVLFAFLMEELDIFRARGTKNSECLYYAHELLRSAVSEGVVSSLKDGVQYLFDLIFEQKKQERCLQLVQGSDCVHIANLHKVKGLQAPIVILALSSDIKSAPSSSVIYGGAEPKKWIFSLGDNTNMDFMFENEKEKEQDLLSREGIRLLYVAATRASNVLIIPKEMKKMKKETPVRDSGYWYRLYTGLSEERNIWNHLHLISETSIEAMPAVLSPDVTQTIFTGSTVSEPTYSMNLPSMIKLHSVKSSDDGNTDDQEPQLSKEEQPVSLGAASCSLNAALRGTLVHRMMEILVSSRNRSELSEIVSEIMREFEVTDSAYKQELLKIGDVMRSGGYFQTNGTPKDILEELLSADQVFCELPFCYETESGRFWNGVMDVVYCKEGHWHIVDYKTNEEASDLDTKYQEQLAAYRDAFRAMTGEEADALIYHIG